MSDGKAGEDVERAERERERALKNIKGESRKARVDGPRGRKLNNQTFPQGSRGLLWKPTPGQGTGVGGEVTGKNQKNKRRLRDEEGGREEG